MISCNLIGLRKTKLVLILGHDKTITQYEHIKVKLQEAKKCLYVIRCLRKEECQQADVDKVFRSIFFYRK